MHRAAVLLLVTLAGPPDARADPLVLRIASNAPEGTAWAREFKALTREIDQATSGRVTMKWYLGGIAGTDAESGERIKRGQLDGVGAGVWQCERWAPSLKVTRLPGLFRNRAELLYVATQLRPLFDEEFKRAGFMNLGFSTLGPSMVFLRDPVRSFDELRKVKLWTLVDDNTKVKLLGALGLTLVPMTFDQSRGAFDRHEVDGFLSPPGGALGFQWSTQARYLLDVVTDDILGCIAVTRTAWERIAIEDRRAVEAAIAKFVVRFDDVGRHSDEQLLGGLFEKQGLRTIRLDPRFRAAFDKAALDAVSTVGGEVAPKQLLEQVRALLTDYRAQKR